MRLQVVAVAAAAQAAEAVLNLHFRPKRQQ